MAGKGDNPRPLSVTPEQFAANFDAIDWNAREREGRERKLFMGEQVIFAPAGGTPRMHASDEFGVIAIDSEAAK